MIHFEGDKHIARPLTEVAEKLSDAGFLANAVPDAQVTEATPDRAVGKIKPKLSFLTGSLTLIAETVSRAPGQSVAYKIETKTMGASSTVETRLEFREADGGTLIHWSGDIVSVTGLLKVVPKGLLEGTARKVIEDVWAAVEARLVGGGQ